MADGQTTTCGLGSLGAKREKYWSEITADEKIERMRQIVHNLLSNDQRKDMEITKLKDALRIHQHIGEKIVVPYNNNTIESGNYRARIGDKEGNEVYF